MAELLDWDESQEPSEENPITPEALAAVDPEVEPEVEEQEPQSEESDIPAKYRGKSVADLVKMHQEAESAIGRKGSEVGELRKIVDEYIRSQTQETQAPPTPVAEEPIDWFDDPDKALDHKLANDPRLKALEQDRILNKRKANLAELQSKHPDYQDHVNDPAFAEWISKSKVRTRLFVDADQNYDTEAADELLSTWKERKALSSSTVEADKASRKEAAKAASNGGATGSGTPQRKQKFRRADVIKLMNTDPDRYAQMADEILLAYKEGRVI